MASPPHTLPHWHNNPPANSLLREWLLNEGSLTRLLQQLSDNQLCIQPVQEGWQQLRDDECLAVGAPCDSQGWVREVFLCGHQQPWVYARSVASRTALEQNGFDLASLGNRSLGELLFSDQAFNRGAFQVCNLPASAWPAALHYTTADTTPLATLKFWLPRLFCLLSGNSSTRSLPLRLPTDHVRTPATLTEPDSPACF